MAIQTGNEKKPNNTIMSVILAALLIVTVYSVIVGNDGVFAPMLMGDLIFLTIWLFKPEKGDSKSAYYAIIAYGAFIALLSVLFSIIVPIYGPQWGWETHPDDQNGILYPAVNDGRENCYFASIVFVFYFIASFCNRASNRNKLTNAKRGTR